MSPLLSTKQAESVIFFMKNTLKLFFICLLLVTLMYTTVFNAPFQSLIFLNFNIFKIFILASHPYLLLRITPVLYDLHSLPVKFCIMYTLYFSDLIFMNTSLLTVFYSSCQTNLCSFFSLNCHIWTPLFLILIS